ncbi:MAG: polysaccharide biosynthesis protein [Acidobacteriota bacterium]
MINPSWSPAELQQLMGRPVRATITREQRLSFAGRRILITGAGGSIGSELARELAACGPATIGLVDHSELALFNIERELRRRWPAVGVEPMLLDVTRGAAIAGACRDLVPHVVYHAAAYKHVTMAERAPAASLSANVLGTFETARAASAARARFVLISSDKAADPKSVMGATKRLAEIVALSMASASFRPVVVRFGNVLGSSGSVLPIMRECVRSGVPIPLTDPEATRFFMTAGEAVALVLRADLLGAGAEIFWLEMGRPIRVADLATRLMALERAAGFAPVPIEIVGLRPGEKRTETLSDPRLVFDRTIDRQIRVARQASPSGPHVGRLVARLRRIVEKADDLAALAMLADVLEGFSPSTQAVARARRRTGGAASPDPLKRKGRAA